MSTRANITIKDGYSTLHFYRHSDGYPSCTCKSLQTLIDWYLTGKIRLDAMQSSGWLIVLGHREYLNYDHHDENPTGGSFGWKVGAYEPTTEIHGDIQYHYTIDLIDKTVSWEDQGAEYQFTFQDFVDSDFSER